MYRPTMYNRHNETMLKFAEIFNDSPVSRNIRMYPNVEETYDNDGVFTDMSTHNMIGYDWEYRDKYFANCILRFSTLGQYERKLKKPSIQLSLQCDSTETGIAVGWHEDWMQEEKEMRVLQTDYAWRESGSTRYTTQFKIYSFAQIDSFKKMIETAMRLHIYSSKIFKLAEKS